MLPEDFWKLVDEAQADTEAIANTQFTITETCDPETLKRILVQYRFFTLFYIGDLAYLIVKLNFGKLRSFMAHVLDEELGSGDETLAHPELYDAFLRSLDIPQEQIDCGIAKNMAMLDQIRQALIREPYPYGLGLRGMGGECMCQIYLSNLHSHFMKNPYIQKNHDNIDWRFWDIHIGPVDVHHREETRALLGRVVLSAPELARQIADGYLVSLQTWDMFWQNIIEAALTTDVVTRRYERRAPTRLTNASGELVAQLRSQYDGGQFRPRTDMEADLKRIIEKHTTAQQHQNPARRRRRTSGIS